MTAPLVRLDEVSKWYGDVLAVNEVTTEFGPGVTGLLGPNGAGKSTLLKLVTGMLAPSLGVVSLAGEPPFSSPHVMRRVGLVPEQDPIYSRSSVLEVTSYLVRLHGFSAREARERARSALERVDLGHVLDRPVATFSKGMRQRAKLAQALAHDPDVFVLDEPLNGLDPVARRAMTDAIRGLGDEGRCVLVSSHVLHEVEAMTRRVLLLDHGRVVADGTVAEIRRDLSDRLTIRVETPDAREVARRLVALEGVLRVDLDPQGTSLDLLAARPDDVFREIARLVTEEGISVRSFRPTDEGLEAVFRYLTT